MCNNLCVNEQAKPKGGCTAIFKARRYWLRRTGRPRGYDARGGGEQAKMDG